MADFVPWGKTPRLFRDVVVTEKIDGTNAAVLVVEEEQPSPGSTTNLAVDGVRYTLYAQSRKRLISPESDNYGFAKWVYTNAETLVQDLGPGRHFGEYWGKGIQRGYGLDHRRFSLFNTSKWEGAEFATANLTVVPVIFEETFSQAVLDDALDSLFHDGSRAAPGFMSPEGICVFHTASNQVYKVLLENDDVPKSAVVNH